MSRHWHTQVQPRLVTLAARGIALARRPRTIHYKLGLTVHRCLQYKAPNYRSNAAPAPISDIPCRRHLRSATRHQLTVPRYRLSCQAFSHWSDNSIPDSLHDPSLTSNSFRQSLKTNLFRCYQHTSQRGRDAS